MDDLGDLEIDEIIRAISEIGVGAAILGLRQINISRRKLVEDVPALEPLVDKVLEQVEAISEPASAIVGSLVSSWASTIPGETGDKLAGTADLIADMGPQLLRMSGLTKRG